MATRPPNAQDISEVIAARLRAVQAQPDLVETVRVSWRGVSRDLPVIRMPLAMLYYNPETHRVRAQRELDPERSALIAADPWSVASQDYLDQLLKGDPSDPLNKVDPTYDELMEDLRINDQRDPGIVTTDGILVNANTRCAALRQIERDHIRVGVLPDDADWQDIASVELSLQLAKEFRRDYSFVNELLAIDELVAMGKSDVDIGRMFKRKTETVKKARWILAFIRESIENSRNSSDQALRLVDYERDKAQLDELHRAYWKLHATDRNAAERLKQARSAAVGLNFAKTDIRYVGSDFVSKYLVPQLPDRLKPKPAEPTRSVIPGLSVSLPTDSEIERELNETILRASAVRKDGAASVETVTRAERDMSEFHEAFKVGIERAKRDKARDDRKAAVPDHLLAAGDEIDAAIDELVMTRAAVGLSDPEAIDGALVELQDSLIKLAQHLRRSSIADGDGIQWLYRVVSLRNE